MAQQELELILSRQWASHLAIPIFIAGSDENLLFYNESAEALLGRRYDEVGEMPLDQLSTIFQTTDEDGAPLAPDALPLGIALRQRKPAHRRIRFRSLDGVWRTIEATAFPLKGQMGRDLGAVAIFWEVDHT
ncbi:MAG: PAS domain-containing protein [Dehalococcoidia bacterium]|nr:PAS domain-containing protein [Dehalococcoidia bacterium]